MFGRLLRRDLCDLEGKIAKLYTFPYLSLPKKVHDAETL